MAIKTVDPVSYDAPVEMNPVMTGDMASIKQRLDAMEKVTVRIPLPKGMTRTALAELIARGEKPPSTPVGVSGYVYVVAHGYDVQVPITVKNILEDAGIL